MSKARLLRADLWILPLLLILLLDGVVWAGSSDQYGVDWHVLSGGGAPAGSSSGAVALNGTLGQTAIGSSSGSGVTVGAGFWYGLGARGYTLYLPLVLRNHD